MTELDRAHLYLHVAVILNNLGDVDFVGFSEHLTLVPSNLSNLNTVLFSSHFFLLFSQRMASEDNRVQLFSYPKEIKEIKLKNTDTCFSVDLPTSRASKAELGARKIYTMQAKTERE